jgi:hypothetical protein
VPFASTPTLAPGIVRDVATDLVYYRVAGMTLKPEHNKIVWDYILSRLNGLATGSLALVTSSGVLGAAGMGAWGTHEDFTNITGMDEVESWEVGDNESDAEADRRL